MTPAEFDAALRVLRAAARDSDWEPAGVDETRQLHALLAPELARLQQYHADQAATADAAAALNDQLREADPWEVGDVHGQLVDVLGQVVDGYRELGIDEVGRVGVTGRGLDTRARVGIP